MAEKEIKLNLKVDSSKGEASIKKTATQIKALGATAASSNLAISAGTKIATSGILIMSAATIRAAGSTTQLGNETHKLIKNMTSSKVAALKEAKAFVKKDVAMLKIMKTMKASAVAINKQKQRVLASVSTMNRFRKEVDKTTRSINKQKKSLDGGGSGGLIGALGKYKAGIIAAIAAGTYIGYTMTKAAAAADQQRKAFSNLAASHGMDADKIISDLKRMSAETVDTATIVQKAGTAIMMGIDPTKLSDLMQIARATSKMTGQSVVEAFDNISMAVGRQSKMILDNLGIIVSIEKANKNYAKQMGITGRELTDMEKKQAFLNETLTKGKDLVNRIGENSDSSIESFARFESAVKDLKIEVGNLGIALTPVIENLAMVAKYWAEFLTPETSADITIDVTKGKIAELREEVVKIGQQLKASVLWGGEDPVVKSAAEKRMENLRFQIKLLQKDLKSLDEQGGLDGDKGDNGEDDKGDKGPSEEEISDRKNYLTQLNALDRGYQREKIILDYEGFERRKALLIKERDFKIADITDSIKDEERRADLIEGVRKIHDLKMAQVTTEQRKEEAAQKAADHETVLQYISTEEENEIRGLLATQALMLEKTDILSEQNAIRERTAELIAQVNEEELTGIQKWAEEAKSFEQIATDVAISASNSFASGFTDAFFEFAEGTKSAKDAFKEFASSFLKQIARMIMQALILKAIQAGVGAMGGGGVQMYGADGAVVSNGNKMMEYAKGATFNKGRMQAFAAGGIVNSPTIFPMANGMGVMGEAGPEAIMPLKRGKGGKLGVEGGGSNTVNTTINVTTGGEGEDPEASKRRGNEMAKIIESEFNRNLTKQMRPGGLLNSV